MIKINKVAAILYVKYLVGGGNELFVVKFMDECVLVMYYYYHYIKDIKGKHCLRYMARIALTKKLASFRVSSRMRIKNLHCDRNFAK